MRRAKRELLIEDGTTYKETMCTRQIAKNRYSTLNQHRNNLYQHHYCCVSSVEKREQTRMVGGTWLGARGQGLGVEGWRLGVRGSGSAARGWGLRLRGEGRTRWARISVAKTFVSLNSRRKGLRGPSSRVIKKQEEGYGVTPWYRGTSLVRNRPPLGPTVGLSLGPYSDPRGAGCFL